MMQKDIKRWIMVAGILICSCLGIAVESVEVAKSGQEQSVAKAEPIQLHGKAALAVVFQGTKDLHFYASSATAPAEGLELKVSAKAEGVTFGSAVLPKPGAFYDTAQGKDIDVYVGNFEVYLPIENAPAAGTVKAEVTIAGIACTSQMCLAPFTKKVAAEIGFAQINTWRTVGAAASESQKPAAEPVAPIQKVEPAPVAAMAEPKPEVVTPKPDQTLTELVGSWTQSGSEEASGKNTIPWYFALALLAGLSINIMPCVLPVIPLIVMRLVSQARESASRRLVSGFAFCGGIILFFAVFAALSMVVKSATGATLDLNSLYRNPTAVVTLFLLIVFFALVLMDVVTLSLPSSLSGQQGGGSGVVGSAAMGFFAAVLSTPCSGAILGAVLVWAQTQPIAVSSTALVLMGVGMALPYAVLVSIPKLLSFVPKPGTWMEHVKKAGGFLLLLIAVKFTLAGLTKDHLINVLLYGVAFAFCAWMWGGWVNFATPAGQKWMIRISAVAIAIALGLWLLPAPQASAVNWQEYDAAVIQKAIGNDKTILIKFTADWCTNCKVVEKNVYQSPDIVKLIADRGVVAIKADTTQEQYPASVDFKAVFGEAGNVPVTIVLNPKSKTITKLRGIFDKQELVKIIP